MADDGISIEMKWTGDNFAELLQREMQKRLATVGEVVRGEATRSLRKTKFPPASKPGHVPAYRTGYLFRSVVYELLPGIFAVRIGTNTKYGRYLELGTSKMAPRPWLRPAIFGSQKRIKAILSKPLPRK